MPALAAEDARAIVLVGADDGLDDDLLAKQGYVPLHKPVSASDLLAALQAGWTAEAAEPARSVLAPAA